MAGAEWDPPARVRFATALPGAEGKGGGPAGSHFRSTVKADEARHQVRLMEMPPSASSAMPVVKLEASEAR